MHDNPYHSMSSKTEVFNWNDNIVKSIQQEGVNNKKNLHSKSEKNNSNTMKEIFKDNKKFFFETSNLESLNTKARKVKYKNESSIFSPVKSKSEEENFKFIRAIKNDSLEIRTLTIFAGCKKGKINIDSRLPKLKSVKNQNSKDNPLSSFKNQNSEFNYDFTSNARMNKNYLN